MIGKSLLGIEFFKNRIPSLFQRGGTGTVGDFRKPSAGDAPQANNWKNNLIYNTLQWIGKIILKRVVN